MGRIPSVPGAGDFLATDLARSLLILNWATTGLDALMLAADLVFWPALAFIVGCNLYYGPQIKSDRIAMQWGFDGKPTWYAPKAIALRGTAAFVLAVRVLIWAAMTYMPAKVNGPEVGMLLFSIIVAASHFWILRAAMRAN